MILIQSNRNTLHCTTCWTFYSKASNYLLGIYSKIKTAQAYLDFMKKSEALY